MRCSIYVVLLAAISLTAYSKGDICQNRYCTKDDGTSCDRSEEGCPICLSSGVGGKVVKCTTPNFLNTCSVLGVGGTKCDEPWKDPDSGDLTPSPTDPSSDSPSTPSPTDTKTTKAPKTTSTPSTPTSTTTLSPTTTKSTSTTSKPTSSQSTPTPSVTSQQDLPTTQQTNTGDANKKDDSSGSGWITYTAIGVGAAAVVAIVAFLVFRMSRRNEDDDDDEESNYKPNTAPAQYNPYSNSQPPPAEVPAAAAAANLRAKLNQQSNSNTEQPPATSVYQNTATPNQPTTIVTEGSRQKSVHTDVWGNVPASFREGGGATNTSFNGSFMSEDSLRRTGNSANGDKLRDNETRLSVEF